MSVCGVSSLGPSIRRALRHSARNYTLPALRRRRTSPLSAARRSRMLRTCPREAMVQAIAASPSTRRSHVVLLVLALYFLAVGVAKPLLRPHDYSDFVTFYSAAGTFALGLSPYDENTLHRQEPPQYSGWVGRYLYPPPFAAAYARPLLRLPFPTARALWVWLECLAYLLAGVALTQVTFGTLRRRAWMATAFLFLPFTPFHFDLKLGSVSGHLLLLCSLFLLARSRGKENLAGLALAAAILLKLSPALLLLVLLVRGERRLVLRTVVATALLVFLCLPWTGWSVYGDYLTQVLPSLARGNYSWFSNQSLDAFFWRLFVPNPDTTPWTASPLLYALLTATTSCGILAALLRVTWLERRCPPGRDEAPALSLLAASLLARITWEYMVVLALPCFLVGLRTFRRGGLGRRATGGLAAAFALCALPFPYAQEPLRSGAGLLLMAPRLAGMLLAFVILAGQIARGNRRQALSARESGAS